MSTKTYSKQELSNYHNQWSEKANDRESSYSPVNRAVATFLIGVVGVSAVVFGKDLIQSVAERAQNEARKAATPEILREHHSRVTVQAGDTVDGINIKNAKKHGVAEDFNLNKEKFEVIADPRNAKTFENGQLDPGEKLYLDSFDN